MAAKNELPVRVIRSRRRKKTISGELKNGELVIRAPAGLSRKALQPHIDSLQERLLKRARRAKKQRSDEELEKMASELNREYFGGKLKWNAIRFVTNQNKRFGSCTPATGEIRLSHRLQQMPVWVLRYVLVHELAHLLEANHGKEFWKLVDRYPLTERARGYLMAVGLEEQTEE